MIAPSDYVQIGDLIYLEDDSKFVGAVGIGSDDAGFTSAMDAASLRSSGEFATRAAFVVQPQSTWSNLQSFKTLIERQGLSMAEGQVSPETAAAYRECEIEKTRNEKETARMAGRTLHFGMVIQLLHHASSKHLSTSRQPASVAGTWGNKLVVDAHAGESGWFKVKPKLKVHNEGEKVHTGDPVVLEEMSSGQRLTFGSVAPDGETQEVVSVSEITNASAFKMQIFRSFADDGTRDLLKAGAACTLFHTETDCFLGSRDAHSAKIELAPDEPRSTAIWQILYQDEKHGAAIRWDGVYRIRHVATGHFLSVQRSRSAGGSHEISLVDGRHADELEMLFRFEPQYALTGKITTLQFMRIRHDSADGVVSYLCDGVLAGAETQAPGGQRSLLQLTQKQPEADVFAVRLFSHETFADLKYVINSTAPFTRFAEAAKALSADAFAAASRLYTSGDAKTADSPTMSRDFAHPLQMRGITNTVAELIRFVTKSDNLDPFTREGMPIESRQLMLSELGVLKLAIDCVEAPFAAGLYTQEDVSTAKKLGSAILEHQRLGKLAMRLVRHILRGQSTNKLATIPLVPELLGQLTVGWGASECLTELFTDNEMVDRVPDETIMMFVDLIRTKGRLAKYIRFLEVLCASRGKAVRVNQWRVARMLLEESPDLLLQLHLQYDGKIIISGDAQNFPKLAEAGGELELCQWLDTTEKETAEYFQALSSLYASLVRGRNLRTSPTLQRLLPYQLVCRVIVDKSLHRNHLDVSRQYVAVARDLWVNNDVYAPPADKKEEHTTMVYVKTVRVWRKVPNIAAERVLSSRYNLSKSASPNWTQYNELKDFAIAFVSAHQKGQNAKNKEENAMLLELVRLVHALILTGFYKSSELIEIIGPLLSLLDGRQDVTGRDGDSSMARYEKETTVTVNTVVIMECKEWLCQIFQLMCTVRLDIRLSLLLGMYASHRSKFGGNGSFEDIDFEHLFGVLQIGSLKTAQRVDKGSVKSTGSMKIMPVTSDMDDDRTGKNLDLVSILIDLTYYKSPALVSAALGLLVRQFEQRKVLDRSARVVQLLVKPSMCNMYSTFDNLLSQLSRLAERRRLYNDETYKVVLLMGQLTARCYEVPDDEDDDVSTVTSLRPEGSVTSKSKSGTRRTSATKAFNDHTAGLFLMCVGKATAKLGSDKLTITHAEGGCPPIHYASRIQLLGKMYDVASVEDKEITLKEPLSPPAVREHASPKLRNGETDTLWIFLERHAEGEANPDMQLLLYNMNCHVAVQKLLRLPIEKEVVLEDIPYREVILGAYRLLKALCSGFKVTQMALLGDITRIVSQTAYNLVSHDITPTGCLIAILKDNPQGCLQISDDLIRKFISLAAETKAPRYLRFLRNVTGTERQPMIRTQSLVMQGLSDNVSAQLLYNGEAGKAERNKLIEADDLRVNPRGHLAYHVEFIGLVARCTEGLAPGPEALARGLFSMADLLEHMSIANLPVALKVQYLKLLDEAYLFVKRSSSEVGSSLEMKRLIESFAEQVAKFTSDMLPNLGPDFEENQDEVAKTHFILTSVMTTVALFLERHYLPGRVSPEVEAACEQFGRAVIELKEAMESDDCVVKDQLPLLMFVRCLKSLTSKDLIDTDEVRVTRASKKVGWKAAGVAVMLANPNRPPKAKITKESLINLERKTASPDPMRPDSISASPLALAEPPGAEQDQEMADRRKSPSSPNVTEAAGATEDEHPQTQLRAFIDAYTSSGDFDAEFSNLVDAFLADLDDGGKRDDTPGGTAQRKPPAQNLIEQLKPQPGAELDVHQAVACAKVLCACLSQEPDDDVLHKRQNALSRFGACAVVIRLVSCEDPDLYKAGLELGKQMLRDGNVLVQQTLYDLVNSVDTAHVAPLDGTGGNFFSRMRDSLRLAVKEVPERITYAEMQADALLNFEEFTKGLAGATIELLRADLDKEFTSNAHPELLLGFLKELCEGHYVPMQDLLHDQPNTIFDIDLVFEVYNLLSHLEPVLNKDNIAQADLACIMLIEVLQGNISGVNSESLLETKLVELCNRLLSTPRNHDDRHVVSKRRETFGSGGGDTLSPRPAAMAPETADENLELIDEDELISIGEMVSLRNSVLTLLQALLETAETATLARMEVVIDLCALANLAGHWYDEYYDIAFGSKRSERRDEARLAMDTGFQAILLLRRITDRRPSLAVSTYAEMSIEAQAHYEKFVGRIELCNESGELERVYFRVPHHFLIAPRTKDKVLWGVDRETPGMAVQEYLLMAPDLHVEVMWQEIVGNYTLWKLIVRYELLVSNSSVFLALLQNLLLLINTSIIEDNSDGTKPESWALTYDILRTTIGMVQTVTCSLAVIVMFGRSTFTLILKRWFEMKHFSSLKELSLSDVRTTCEFLTLTTYVVATDIDFLMRVLFVVFAVCGNVFDERYFVIHLIQVVLQNKGLMDVLRAVTQNAKQLLLTCFLLVIVIWMFAVWGHEVRSDFLTDEGAEEKLCRTPGHCWLEIVNSLATGDIADLLMNRPRFENQENWHHYWAVWIYQFLLFVVVVIVLLNVVFGIIIDTFGELRGEKVAKKTHMENVCFICGVDRFTFDTKGAGFDVHIRKDHWMWTYLAMMIHVREKDSSDHNGWETYVAAKMKAKDTSFMPRNTAIVLQDSENAEEAETEEIKKRLGDVEAQNRQMLKLLETLQRDSTEIMDRLITHK